MLLTIEKNVIKDLLMYPSRDNLMECRKISIAIKIIKKKKRENFTNFINDLNFRSGPSLFWRTINAFKCFH